MTVGGCEMQRREEGVLGERSVGEGEGRELENTQRSKRKISTRV